MHFTVYKITNKKNGKFYIGIHKTDNLDDGYMGSGKRLKRAQKRDGLEFFNKEILFDFDNYEEMVAKEKEIVIEEFLKRDDVYNLDLGGGGGWHFVNNDLTLEERKRISSFAVTACKKLWNENPDHFINSRRKSSKRLKDRHDQGLVKYDTFTGRSHTDETKAKMRENHKGLQAGSKNSQFGTMWIFNEDTSTCKKIKRDELDLYIQLGWRPGKK